MRDSLHNDEFESFLYKQVKDHRMYPADQLWRNIQKEIHGEGRWPALTYISIFIITALSVCTLMVKPEERMHKNTIAYPPQKEETSFNKTTTDNEKNAVAAAPVQYAYTDRITQQTMQSVSNVIIAREEKQNAVQPLIVTKESLLPVQDKAMLQASSSSEQVTTKSSAKQSEQLQAAGIVNAAHVDKLNEDKLSPVDAVPQYAAVTRHASRYFSTLGLINPADLKRPSDNLSSAAYNNDDIWRNNPLLNSRDAWRRTLSKFSFQFYVTPSVSYRRLNDAKGRTAQSYTALPRTSTYQLDVNHVVEHHPAIGAETGFALGYKLSKTLTAKGGLQFNVRQYEIKAYSVPIRNPSANALPDNTAGTGGSADEESTNNAYLTSASEEALTSHQIVLNNRYYEIAIPIGIDLRIANLGNSDRLTINAAASLQPTYTFDKEPFVITTNYKNYADGASIMHNWNLNSNVEAYISYKMGAFRWQLGPQFRWQNFSTYSNAYPIREHLLDYGIKFGFTKSLD